MSTEKNTNTLEKWNKRLDKISQMFDFNNERELAKFLRESPATLSKYRNGQREISLKTKLFIMDAIGYTNVREVVLELLGKERAEAITDKHNKFVKKMMKLEDDEK